MRRFHLAREQFVPLPLDETFAFFANVRNLEQLTPPWLHFDVLTPAQSEIRAGSLIDYRLRLHGVPLRWQSQITLWAPPHRFVDVQRRGPYRFWEHTHAFEPLASGTVVRDHVRYAVVGGEIVNHLIVRPDLERVFDYRARALNIWAIQQLRGGTSMSGI